VTVYFTPSIVGKESATTLFYDNGAASPQSRVLSRHRHLWALALRRQALAKATGWAGLNERGWACGIARTMLPDLLGGEGSQIERARGF
jgi:hypothetical protein